MTKAILQIGYCTYLISAQDAQTVMGILDGKSVDVSYISEQEARAFETTRGQQISYTEDNRMSANMIAESDFLKSRERGLAKERWEMAQELIAEERERERVA